MYNSVSYTFRALVEVWCVVSIGSCQFQVLYGREERKKWQKETYIQGQVFFFNFPLYSPQLADELPSVTCACSRPYFCSKFRVTWQQMKQSSALSLIQGWAALPSLLTLSPDTEKFSPPHMPLVAGKPAARHQGEFIKLESMFNKHDGVEMA